MKPIRDIQGVATTPGTGGAATAAPARDNARREEMLDALARAVCDRRLSAPAIFALEMARPLNFIGSQLMHALGPLASLIVDDRKWTDVAEALEDRATITRLLDKIEALERASSPAN
jgi:hypothetical protein